MAWKNGLMMGGVVVALLVLLQTATAAFCSGSFLGSAS